MKSSPLQLETPQYPIVNVRAYPHDNVELLRKELPVSLECSVAYELDGQHFAMLSITQGNKELAYTFEIHAITSFTMDLKACQASYKSSFNPVVVAVNVCRILYSSAREMLASVSARSPHGVAMLPSTMIEPGDVQIEFENGAVDEILKSQFGLTDEELDALKKFAAEKSQQKRVAQGKKRTVAVSRNIDKKNRKT